MKEYFDRVQCYSRGTGLEAVYWNMCTCGWRGRDHFPHNDHMFTNLSEERNAHLEAHRNGNSDKIKEMKEPISLLKERVDIDFRLKLLGWFGSKKFTIRDVRDKLSSERDVAFDRRYRDAYCGGKNTSPWGLDWNIDSFHNRTKRHIERSILKYGGRKYVEHTEVKVQYRSKPFMEKRNIRLTYQLV